MASSDSTTSAPAVDSAVVWFEEMYRQDPSLRPNGLMGGIDHSRVLSAVPLHTSVTVASTSRAPPLRKKKKPNVAKGKNPKSLPVTVLETGPITNTGCLLLDVDFDEALRFVGDGYTVRRPHTTNHVFSVTCPDAEVGVHVASMRYGLRFPPHDLIVQFLNFYNLLPGQLSPHSYYCFSIFLIKCHQRGVPWSLDLFRYMFKISKVGALEGNSYAVVSSQAECGMAVFPSSLKLWKAKFVFISGFPGGRHPFRARFPVCHTFVRHPRPQATPELLAYTQKLLEDCRPKPPHVYTICTEQNLAEVGMLISLERQFELTEAVLGGRPKHGLEDSAPRSEDLESGGEEVEDDEEVESDEESEQPPYSEGIADVDPSVGDMNPVDMIRKAKLLARNRSRGEEVQQKTSSENASGPIVPVPNPETASTRNLRKRKVIQVEDEDTASEQDMVLNQDPMSKRPTGPLGGKCPNSSDKVDGDANTEAEAASLSAVLKEEDKILLSLQKLVEKASAKLNLISQRRAGVGFSAGVDSLASVELELSRLRKLAETEHEQAVELQMQAVAKSEEVRSAETERDQLLAEREQAAAEKERAISDFLQSPSFKETCLERMAAYYEDWIKTEAGIAKMGVEGTTWFESGVYHGIKLVLRRTRRVDPSFPPPGVDIPEMHDPNLNAELGENPFSLGTPEHEEKDAEDTGDEQPSNILP
ncbi:unnamed protein product [Cuscuta campestris]|uniref:Transposase (putative) gypsy type domain-containing protein n=1 Tax=Cuscuta campestris TaxID=132261 RepID=A0A484KXD9_9ASTE|nr:unnamed protein product [Cuscuta campestris]